MNKNKPASRMRDFLSSPENKLPKKKQEEDAFAGIPRGNVQEKTKSAPPSLPPRTPPSQEEEYSGKEKKLRALWTLTAIISMTVNIVVIVLLVLLIGLYSTNASSFVLPDGIGINTPKDLLKGLYDNFQLMDQAHIRTNIEVKDTIPVQFELPLKQATVVSLTEPVTISGARVTLSTGGLNIVNAPATVILPAGTVLPIMLDLVVPVNEEIEITLNVPVDIPLEQTDLHTPFTALQKVVQPLYCLVAPNAKMLNGGDVCK